ncbi:hypothetical protein ACFL1I_08285 [Candidatus Omnitrophota bacterium]
MGVIKGVLREELENSIRLIKDYQQALKKHPGGSLIRKKIKGRKYYYLAYREGNKVKFIYKGKKISKEDLEQLQKSKQLRLKYKKLIQKLNKRIKYLRKVIRGKEDV